MTTTEFSFATFDRICAYRKCQKPFSTDNVRKVYCHPDCRHAAQNDRYLGTGCELEERIAEGAAMHRKRGYDDGYAAALSSTQARVDEAYRKGIEVGKSIKDEPFSMMGGRTARPTSGKGTPVNLESPRIVSSLASLET